MVNSLPFLKPFRGVVDKIQTLMGWPVIILGVVCLVFWLLRRMVRKIANQSADFCERVVEAQFATHTKGLKSRRREQDAQFLAERVIDPELLLPLVRRPDRPHRHDPIMTRRPRHGEPPGSRTASWRSCEMFACCTRIISTARPCTAATPRRRCSCWATWPSAT